MPTRTRSQSRGRAPPSTKMDKTTPEKRGRSRSKSKTTPKKKRASRSRSTKRKTATPAKKVSSTKKAGASVTIKKSSRAGKKFEAVFTKDGKKVKTVHFGATGYSDYTKHKDKERRQRYRNRHRNDRINEAMTPGALSWYVLWGESTNFSTNVQNYKRRFNLK